jgi:hypothetical protein
MPQYFFVLAIFKHPVYTPFGIMTVFTLLYRLYSSAEKKCKIYFITVGIFRKFHVILAFLETQIL